MDIFIALSRRILSLVSAVRIETMSCHISDDVQRKTPIHMHYHTLSYIIIHYHALSYICAEKLMQCVCLWSLFNIKLYFMPTTLCKASNESYFCCQSNYFFQQCFQHAVVQDTNITTSQYRTMQTQIMMTRCRVYIILGTLIFCHSASFCTTFLKDCGRGESLRATTCLNTMVWLPRACSL